MSDQTDNATLQTILSTGESPAGLFGKDTVASHIVESYEFLRTKLREDLTKDPFKRLGIWADFLTNRVYFAVFIHPDDSLAYQVYEVINTRGKELTTADLLKNYVLSQTPNSQRPARYRQWKAISRQFSEDSAAFVQYIRHVVTVESGHILPKDLFGFLAGRVTHFGRKPPSTPQLMALLERHLPLYLQMMDPTLPGPAEQEALKIFSALNSLNVIAVRPILLALADVPRSLQGMNYVLRLVLRRIAVGGLGTGNVERRFGESAKGVQQEHTWKVLESELRDLNPTRDDFVEQVKKRSFTKVVLAFLRRSIITSSITPEEFGVLHYIRPRQASDWRGMSEEDGANLGSTIGNTFLSTLERRPREASNWRGFKEYMLPYAAPHEWRKKLERVEEWNADAVERIGSKLAEAAGDIWY